MRQYLLSIFFLFTAYVTFSQDSTKLNVDTTTIQIENEAKVKLKREMFSNAEICLDSVFFNQIKSEFENKITTDSAFAVSMKVKKDTVLLRIDSMRLMMDSIKTISIANIHKKLPKELDNLMLDALLKKQPLVLHVERNRPTIALKPLPDTSAITEKFLLLRDSIEIHVNWGEEISDKDYIIISGQKKGMRVIPKLPFGHGIDKTMGNFSKNNWIWIIPLCLTLLICLLSVAIVFFRKKRKQTNEFNAKITDEEIKGRLSEDSLTIAYQKLSWLNWKAKRKDALGIIDKNFRKKTEDDTEELKLLDLKESEIKQRTSKFLSYPWSFVQDSTSWPEFKKYISYVASTYPKLQDNVKDYKKVVPLLALNEDTKERYEQLHERFLKHETPKENQGKSDSLDDTSQPQDFYNAIIELDKLMKAEELDYDKVWKELKKIVGEEGAFEQISIKIPFKSKEDCEVFINWHTGLNENDKVPDHDDLYKKLLENEFERTYLQFCEELENSKNYEVNYNILKVLKRNLNTHHKTFYIPDPIKHKKEALNSIKRSVIHYCTKKVQQSFGDVNSIDKVYLQLWTDLNIPQDLMRKLSSVKKEVGYDDKSPDKFPHIQKDEIQIRFIDFIAEQVERNKN